MNGEAFQLNKLRRLIRTQGKQFLVEKPSFDKFNEPDGNTEVVSITGVFHELTGYKSKKTDDATSISKRTSPMVLILWEDVSLFNGDATVKFNNKPYRVCTIKNLGECNLVADISLEEVLT